MTLAIISDPRNAHHRPSALFTSLNTIDRMLPRATDRLREHGVSHEKTLDVPLLFRLAIN